MRILHFVSVIFILLSIIVISFEEQHSCRVTFKFVKVCNRYKIDINCQPGTSRQDCQRIKTTYNDRRCPIYDCTPKSTSTTTPVPTTASSTTVASTTTALSTTTPVPTTASSTTVASTTTALKTTTPFTKASLSSITALTRSSTRALITKRPTRTTASLNLTLGFSQNRQRTKTLPKKRWMEKLTQNSTGVWCFNSKCYTKTKFSQDQIFSKRSPKIFPTLTESPISRTTTTSTQSTSRPTSSTTLSTRPTSSTTLSTRPTSSTTLSTTIQPTHTTRFTTTTSPKTSKKTAIKNNKNKLRVFGLSGFNFLDYLLPTKMKQLLTAIDCGDKTCSLRHEVKRDCVVYLHSNNTDCDIPCKLDGCKTEIHRFMNCPIWDCIPITTTTSTTTMSTTTTATETTSSITPQPCPPCPIVHPHNVISIILNIVLILGICSFVIYKNYERIVLCCRRCRPQRSNERPRRTSLPPNDSRYFTMGSDVESNNDLDNDNIPLVPSPSNQSQGFTNVDLNSPTRSFTPVPLTVTATIETVQTPLISTTRFRTTFQSAPRSHNYVRSYSTFKPEIVQRRNKPFSNALETLEHETRF